MIQAAGAEGASRGREREYRAETVIVLVGLRIYFSSEICYEIILIKIADMVWVQI